MSGEILTVIILALVTLSSLVVIWMAVTSRRQIREMEHRERLAMIERGLLPAPELDPGAFDQRFRRRVETHGSVRFRSAGIMMIGLGLAFMLLVSLAGGSPAVGAGIGLAFAVLGGAFLANAMMLSRSQRYVESPAPPATPLPRKPESRLGEEE